MTIAVASLKGGVGKTTTAIQLSAALAELGSRVLLVDLDAQGGVSSYFGQAPREASAVDVLMGRCSLDEAVIEVRPRLTILPADERLAGLETLLLLREQRLERLYDALQRGPAFNIVLIDTAPSINFAALNALYAADYLLVPVVLEMLPLRALSKQLTMLRATIAREQLTARLARHSLIPNFFEARTRERRAAYEELCQAFGPLVGPPIHASVLIPEAARAGKTIFEHAPRSRVAQDFAGLVKEVVQWQVDLLRGALAR